MRTYALLGDREPRFASHRELDAALELFPEGTRGEWVPTDSAAARDLSGYDGVWVVPGSPYRDEDAVSVALQTAREAGRRLLATCAGFQYLVVEFARNVAGIEGAAHGEAHPDADNAVAAPLGCTLDGEQRTVTTVPGTRIAAICGTVPFAGTHFCSFGVAGRFVADLEAAGLVMSAHAPDAGVEAVELPGHPFYVGTLFQPQVGSLAGEPLHPLIRAFLDA